MSLILKKGKDFAPAPEGVHNAICVDVVNLGLVDKVWKNKVSKVHMVRIVWEIDQLMDTQDGKRPFLVSNRYTFSMDKKANLRKMLKTWRGRDFTDEEMNGFDLEAILGVPCQVIVTHTQSLKDDKTYANIESVIKAGKEKLSASGGYKRVKDREGYEPPVMKHVETDQNHPNYEGGDNDSNENEDAENCPF